MKLGFRNVRAAWSVVVCVSLVETNTLYPTGSKRVQTFTLCLGHSFLSARRSFKAQRSPSRTVRVVYQTVSFSSSKAGSVSEPPRCWSHKLGSSSTNVGFVACGVVPHTNGLEKRVSWTKLRL